jgi:hypothetical protein
LRDIFFLYTKADLSTAVPWIELSLSAGDLNYKFLLILGVERIYFKKEIMSSIQNDTRSSARSENTRRVVQAFDALSTDDKLALLYYVYEKMGDSITPAAPTAANPEFAPRLLGEFFDMSDEQQLEIMRSIVNCEDTELSRAYGALTENNQLLVWYAWAVGMGDTVVDIPNDYQRTNAINDTLSQIEGLDFEGQISLLREIVGNMGYSEVKPIPTQAETGKTPSL